MASEISKKKQTQEEIVQKSKGVNATLWSLAIIIIIASAFANVYFADKYSMAIRVVGLSLALVIAFALLAITNQGKRALTFLSESRIELRRIVWPTRPEAMQTTFIVIGVTVLSSLILWGFDSIIVAVLNFLTNLRF